MTLCFFFKKLTVVRSSALRRCHRWKWIFMTQCKMSKCVKSCRHWYWNSCSHICVLLCARGAEVQAEAQVSSSLRRLDFSGFGNSTRLPLTGGTHQRIPSLLRSFGSMIYTFWSERVLNFSIKELRIVPWARHSNESTPMIAATFNRQKLVFSVLQTSVWRKLSGAEESGWKRTLKSTARFTRVVFVHAYQGARALSRATRERRHAGENEQRSVNIQSWCCWGFTVTTTAKPAKASGFGFVVLEVTEWSRFPAGLFNIGHISKNFGAGQTG